MRRWWSGTLLCVLACGGAPGAPRPGRPPAATAVLTPRAAAAADPTRNPDAAPLAIRGGTVLTATGRRLEPGVVVLRGGAIEYVGDDAGRIPAGATTLDATGKVVTPGLIDAHTHVGVFPMPQVGAHEDGNEMVAAITAAARAEYAYWPQDPAIPRARAGGVTAALALPGSANLIGGRGATVVMRPGRTIDDVSFPAAPATLKMACGENPKRVHGGKAGPMTRMAEGPAVRAAFAQAAEYQGKHREHARKRGAGKPSEAPPRDLGLETLAGVLDGDTLVHVHCYRADDLRHILALADELGFRVRAFHHALEAYKVRELLTARGVAVATWADWWGGKLEMLDGIPENAALFTAAGGRAIIHSDSAIGIQRLNQEAAKAMYAGHAAGIAIDDDQALRWITANPAWALGVDRWVGTLEAGKRADVVIWSASPWSVYARAEVVVQAGEVTYRAAEGLAPSDFELGTGEVAR